MMRAALAVGVALAAAAVAHADASAECHDCWGHTYGPCQHVGDGSCFGYFPGTFTCPPGSAACTGCSGCWGHTHGPCKHDNDGSCMDYYPGTTTCPPGTTRCATGTSQAAVPSTRGRELDGDSPVSCGNCAGQSSGPCRHNANKVCHQYISGTTTCPAGTSPCVPCAGCAGGTSGPCKHNNDATCFGYQDGSGTTCPAGTYHCATGEAGGGHGTGDSSSSGSDASPPAFGPPFLHNLCMGCTSGGGPCKHNNDGTCFQYLPGTFTCPAGSTACPPCSACIGSSSGPCMHINDGSCHNYQIGTTCPAGTVRCATGEVSQNSVDEEASDRRLEVGVTAAPHTCGNCAGLSTGPCKHNANNVCHGYMAGTTQCPAGTTACVECLECAPGTSGPCKHGTSGDNQCQGYSWGTTCAVGYVSCATGETGSGSPPVNDDPTPTPNPTTPVDGHTCLNCWGSTSGPCKHNGDGSCMNWIAGTQQCPPGSTACIMCVGCEGGTAGPCRHLNDNTCVGYDSGSTCPAGTVRCATGEIVGEPAQRRLDGGSGGLNPTYTCSGCAGGTSGPCRHNNDGTCLAYFPGTTTCPAGSTQCSECHNCLAGTSGPCMHANLGDFTCFGYEFGTTCPVGTFQCATAEAGGGSSGGSSSGSASGSSSASGSGSSSGGGGGVSYPPFGAQCGQCVGGTSGPCKHNNDNTCLAFSDPAAGLCPAGSTPCDTCTGCLGGTSGPCQHLNDGTCLAYNAGTSDCPAGSMKCSEATGTAGILSISEQTCGACLGGSSGPCRHDDSDVCHQYYAGTTTCPSGTRECVPCTGCTGQTAGPCKHNNDQTCQAYSYGHVCAAGTVKCSTGEQGGGAPSGGASGLCSGCWAGTSGPCQSSNTVCYGYFPGTTMCPAGTNKCAVSGSAEGEPIVVLDVTLEGVTLETFDEGAFAAGVAESVGTDKGNVHVDSVVEINTRRRRGRALDVSGVSVGAIVTVPRASGASVNEVSQSLSNAASSGALTDNLKNAGLKDVAGTRANSAPQAAVPGSKVPKSAGAGEEGMSSAAVTLFIAGAVVVATALVVGGVMYGRSSSTTKVETLGPKKVTAKNMKNVKPTKVQPSPTKRGGRKGGALDGATMVDGQTQE